MVTRINTFNWSSSKEAWTSTALPQLTSLRIGAINSVFSEASPAESDVRINVMGFDSELTERRPLLTFYMADGYLFMRDHALDTVYSCDCSLTDLQMKLFAIDKVVRGAL